MDATVLPFQLTFKGNMEEDSFDLAWLWITTLIFGIDVATALPRLKRRERTRETEGKSCA